MACSPFSLAALNHTVLTSEHYISTKANFTATNVPAPKIVNYTTDTTHRKLLDIRQGAGNLRPSLYILEVQKANSSICVRGSRFVHS